MNHITKYLFKRVLCCSKNNGAASWCQLRRVNFCSNFARSEDDSDEQEYQNLVNRYLRVSEMGHQVLIVQPYVKWGPSKKTNTTPQLQLDEAVSLIGTLAKWQVVEKVLVPVERLSRKVIFGRGNLDKLKDKVKHNKNISAVFISVSMMKGFQRRDYEELFQVPVFDRYSIVIQIFKNHAITKDAQLQVALAEVPYLRAMLSVGQDNSRTGGAPSKGSGETTLEVGRRVLLGVESKIQDKLKKVHDQRALSRKKRMQLNIPVVAVVGYTNAGKTSLIKALTGERQMQPRDALFATLDVTAHEGLLPCRLKVLYVDTVGFMSDLPTSLIECFIATLEDVLLADVIVHIVDLSHPDVKAQAENVITTLRSLQVPESVLSNIVTVGNKCDRKQLFDLEHLNPIKISATEATGISVVSQELEKSILTLTSRQKMIIRVTAGGQEARWLHKEAAVVEMWPDPEDCQYMMMGVVISKIELAKFKNYFIDK